MATSNGPPLPSEVAATVITSGDSICTAFVKLIRCYVYVYRLIKYEWTESKQISPALCSEIKACVALNAGTTTP